MHDTIKKELHSSLIADVQKLFKNMFSITVEHDETQTLQVNDDDLVTATKILINVSSQPDQDQANKDNATQSHAISKIIVRFLFPRQLIRPLLLQSYEGVFAEHESAYEDAACEISNVVSSGVKKTLSVHNYNSEMFFPEIDYDSSFVKDTDRDILRVHFIQDKSYFFVEVDFVQN